MLRYTNADQKKKKNMYHVKLNQVRPHILQSAGKRRPIRSGSDSHSPLPTHEGCNGICHYYTFFLLYMYYNCILFECQIF
jgi:hypothetical protein